MKNHFDTSHLQDQLKVRSARGGLATMAAQGVRFIVNLCGILVLSRLLAPDDFGIFAMVTSVTGAVVLLKDMGLSAATIQRATITPAQVTTLFWVNVAVSATISILLVLSAPLFVWFYGQPQLAPIVIASAAGFFVGGLSVQHQALLSRQMEFVRLAMVDIGAIFLSTLLGIFLAWRGFGTWSLVIMQVTAATLSTIGLWFASKWIPGRPTLDRSAFSMLAFGAQLTGVNLLNFTSRNIDNVLIGRYTNPQQLGLYFRAYQLLMLPLYQISAPVTSVAVPALSRLLDEPERYRAAYLKILRLVLLIAIPEMAFLMATADDLVALALGTQWAAATPMFVWLSIVGITQPVTNSCGWLFTSQGRTGEFVRQAAIDCTLSVIAIVAGLPWGAVGVAASYAVSGLLVRAPVVFWLAGRNGPVRTRDLYPPLLRILPLGACVWLAVWLTKPHLAAVPMLLRMGILFVIAAGVVASIVLGTAKGRLLVRESFAMLRKSPQKS